MEWVHRARCKDEDPELFFPVGTTGPAAAQLAAAKAICMQCEVRAECLEWAMATGQDAGGWGGLAEDEGRALRGGRRSTATRRLLPTRYRLDRHAFPFLKPARRDSTDKGRSPGTP